MSVVALMQYEQTYSKIVLFFNIPLLSFSNVSNHKYILPFLWVYFGRDFLSRINGLKQSVIYF